MIKIGYLCSFLSKKIIWVKTMSENVNSKWWTFAWSGDFG